MGWLINFALLEDRIILILFRFFKLGIIRTKSLSFSGISIVIGVWRYELQVNLSRVNDIKINFENHDTGKA